MAARHPPCRALKPKEKDYKVTDRDGMYVHVTQRARWCANGDWPTAGCPKSASPFGGFAITMPKCCGSRALARVANMSATSFFRHFRAVTLIDADPVPEACRAAGSAGQTLASLGDVAAVRCAVGYD